MNLPVGQLSKAHVQAVAASEAGTEVRVSVGQAVDGGSAEGHKQQLASGRGCRGRLREELEAPSDQHGAAAPVLQLKGLGGLHTTYEAPFWRCEIIK